MAEHPEHDPEPDLTKRMIPSPPDDPCTPARAVGDAWEAVVRAELASVRRGRARDRRSARSEPQEAT